MTITGATLFAGGGGADIGMKMAGITPIGGIEYDPAIAEVARANGIPVIVADILSADPLELRPVDVLHASPPCPNFSIAKTDAKEAEIDKDLARKVAQFIAVMLPSLFTLENVYGYRNSESWRIICDALMGLGYAVRYDHVNFANLGVPQTRKRMIVRAVRGANSTPRIKYTHEQSPTPMFGLLPWVGWYEAVEDLIPTFKETKFADWQLQRMPEFYDSFLAEGRAGGERGLQVRSTDKPSMTITTSSGGNIYRSFIADSANAQSNGKRKYRLGDEPAKTVTASDSGSTKVFIVDGANASRLSIRQEEEPSFTIVSSYKSSFRFRKNGRVLALSMRALARLQSFPDWYQLPDKKSLACKIIGNAVPPAGMAKIYRQLLPLIGGEPTQTNQVIL